MSQPRAAQDAVVAQRVASPVPPPPPPAPLRARNVRLTALLLCSLVALYLGYVTLPVVVANTLTGTYPRVQAVIVGAHDGQSVREGQSITLSAQKSVGKHLTYRWDFADGAMASGVRVTRAFAHFAANFQVTLTVSDPLGATNPTGHHAVAQITIRVL